MDKTRYIYKTVPITVEEAELDRLKKMEFIEGEIDSLQQDLIDLKITKLPTTKQVQISLEPGDEGYNEAPVGFSPHCYQGDTKWINQTSPPTQPKNG
jgi:hypothetical protein